MVSTEGENRCQICGMEHSTGWCQTPEGKTRILESKAFEWAAEKSFQDLLRGGMERGELSEDEARAVADKYLGGTADDMRMGYQGDRTRILPDEKARKHDLKCLNQLLENAQVTGASEETVQKINDAIDAFRKRYPEIR